MDIKLSIVKDEDAPLRDRWRVDCEYVGAAVPGPFPAVSRGEVYSGFSTKKAAQGFIDDVTPLLGDLRGNWDKIIHACRIRQGVTNSDG